VLENHFKILPLVKKINFDNSFGDIITPNGDKNNI
jgi:hypothetical protein